MNTREQIESQIRESSLTTETRTTVLSNKLFQQGTGLFGRLAETQEERRVLIQTELFQTALNRVRELEYRDAEVLREAVKVLHERLPDAGVRLSLDSSPVRAS